MAPTHTMPGEHVYEDVTYMKYTPAHALDAVKEMNLRDDDILLVTYPKAGTTWLSEIACLLQPQEDVADIRSAAPIVEFEIPGKQPNAILAESTPSPRILTTHLRPSFFEKPLQNSSPRVIVLMRNPKDCLVSYYHFYRANAALGKFQGSFDEFFQLHSDKKACYGDVIEHVALWLKYKDDPRFIFLTFEDMKADSVTAIRTIADFLKIEISDAKVCELADKTSFEKMSKDPRVNKEQDKMHDSSISKYLRKGAVGDWASLFTAEQSQLIDDRCRKELEPLGMKFDFGHVE